MTLMPEAKLAREAELCYALIALPTDYDCWRPHEVKDQGALLTEIIGNLRTTTAAALTLLRAALPRSVARGERVPVPGVAGAGDLHLRQPDRRGARKKLDVLLHRALRNR